jgi:ribosomal protein S18 acetylase RimI-like enzyme
MMWFVHPSSTPDDLGARLAAHGLAAVEALTYMSLDLAGWAPPPRPDGVRVAEVTTDEQLAAVPGHRYLATAGGETVGKAWLSFAGPAGVAAIYGMSVRPEARGRGVAQALTTALLTRGRAVGCRRVVLQSSAMALELYRRAGFTEHLDVPVYATAPLWSGDH